MAIRETTPMQSFSFTCGESNLHGNTANGQDILSPIVDTYISYYGARFYLYGARFCKKVFMLPLHHKNVSQWM